MAGQCKVCGGSTAVQLSAVADSITNETFSICRCKSCGVGETVPRPEDLSRYYGEVYYGKRHGFTSVYCIRRRLNFIQTAGRSMGGKLLDVGCGDGSFLLAARDKGWSVAGVEIQPDAAKAAGLDVFETIGEASSEGPFDCITLWHSLEHMDDPKSALMQLSKLLAPGGTIFVAVPNSDSWQARVCKHYWIPLDVPRHLFHFAGKSLRFCLGQAGLSVRRKWNTELEYDLMGWSQSALNAMTSVPNVFLDLLAGKQRGLSLWTRALHLTFGCILTGLALLPTLLEAGLGRGGTLVIVAGPKE